MNANLVRQGSKTRARFRL